MAAVPSNVVAIPATQAAMLNKESYDMRRWTELNIYPKPYPWSNEYMPSTFRTEGYRNGTGVLGLNSINNYDLDKNKPFYYLQQTTPKPDIIPQTGYMLRRDPQWHEGGQEGGQVGGAWYHSLWNGLKHGHDVVKKHKIGSKALHVAATITGNQEWKKLGDNVDQLGYGKAGMLNNGADWYFQTGGSAIISGDERYTNPQKFYLQKQKGGCSSHQ